MINEIKKERIALKVISILHSRFNSFPDNENNNRNAPFHEAFLEAFVHKFEESVINIPFIISLSSWLHGLSTSLGQSFFEEVAHVLSDGQKKGFTKNSGALLKVTTKQKKNIADIITDLKNGNKKPNLSRENDLIFIEDGNEIEANSFTADVYIEDSKEIICIEIKSVKPNSGEMRSEKQKILEAKAALFHSFPDKSIKYYIGFPFDPTSDTPTGFSKKRFLGSIIDGDKYFDNKEVLIASEFWDLLSGEKDTMALILQIINKIATPQFKEEFNKINNNQVSVDEKKDILKRWYLISELKLLEKESEIREKIKKNRQFERIYNQNIFNEKGKYNWRRYDALRQLLKTKEDQ